MYDPRTAIPNNPLYCYDESGLCPFWKAIGNGDAKCIFLDSYSEQYDPGNLIWDQCKECGINKNWVAEEEYWEKMERELPLFDKLDNKTVESELLQQFREEEEILNRVDLDDL